MDTKLIAALSTAGQLSSGAKTVSGSTVNLPAAFKGTRRQRLVFFRFLLSSVLSARDPLKLFK